MGNVWEVSQLLHVVVTLVVTDPIKVTVLRTAAKAVSGHEKKKHLFFIQPTKEQMLVTPVISDLEQSFPNFLGMCECVHPQKRERGKRISLWSNKI